MEVLSAISDMCASKPWVMDLYKLMQVPLGPKPRLIVVQDLTNSGVDKVELIKKLEELASGTVFTYTPSESIKTTTAASGKAQRWLTSKLKVKDQEPYDPHAVQFILINCRDGVHVPIFFIQCLMQAYVIWRAVPLTVSANCVVVFVRKPNKSLLKLGPTKVITLVENTESSSTYSI
jgi:hypothetical protein